ncbi:DUF803-domain-containing protein, partial [Amylocystis lapponica]
MRTSPAHPHLFSSLLFDDSDTGRIEFPDLPRISRATFAGILIAISGNVLISLALNCQKLAHQRLEREREVQAQELSNQAPGHATHTDAADAIRTSGASSGIDMEDTFGDEESGVPLKSPASTPVAVSESEPLLRPDDRAPAASYGASEGRPPLLPPKRRTFFSRFAFRKRDRSERPFRDADTSHLAITHALVPVDVVTVLPESLANGDESRPGANAEDKEHYDGNESDYLKSKLWWLGFLLMNVGECGNFISYAFAPASLVAPLGTFALIANCLFAPVMLKERFRTRDFFGIIIAVIGAVTVVLSANPSDVRLDPAGLIHAITQRPFIVYSAVYVAGIIVLSSLSEGRVGKRWVYVDVGLCALFGGFTVLSTKAISTLLTLEWFEMFTEWITYPVLLGTGICQIKYLNRALMRFDSKIVVPTQFVLFNLSTILGSAILYADFKEATFHQIVTFLYGCATTFAGVFIIAWAPSPADDDPSPTIEDESMHGDGLVFGGTGETTPVGSMARRNRVKSAAADYTSNSPILRSRVSVYGLSPAQRVLLLSSPPREGIVRPHSQDVERNLESSPDAHARQRAVSWLEDGA